jgi:hypothetical protein
LVAGRAEAVYDGVSQQALDLVRPITTAARITRCDCTAIAMKATCCGPTRSAMSAALRRLSTTAAWGRRCKDFWMLLGAGRSEQTERLADLLEGYEDFAEFDRRELSLIEPLRTLRLLHYAAWVARRWDDPAFPAAFPWFNTQRYGRIEFWNSASRIAAMQGRGSRRLD